VQQRRLKKDEKRLKDFLHRKGVPVGDVYCFDQVKSTMDVAFCLNREGARNRTLVFARDQIGGRGRYGRPWFSEPGGLYASILLTEYDPDIPYSMLVSYALFQVFRKLGATVSLKWVNDVLCRNGSKVAGVLTEEGEGCTVIGMGVNVNNRGFPSVLRGNTTSLYLETGREFGIIDLLCNILEQVFPILKRAHEGGIAELLADWEQEAALRGRSVKLVGAYGETTGIVRGINRRNGSLILSVDDEVREIYEGSLFYVD